MKRKGGFTLVELLIVIMIIGILAGMVLLSMGPVLDSVKASNIISDTRTVLSAAQMFLIEEMKTPEAADAAKLEGFMNKKLDTKKYAAFAFVKMDNGAEYVGVELTGDYKGDGVKGSLKKKAADVGGVGAAKGATDVTNPYNNEDCFLLPLRQATL